MHLFLFQSLPQQPFKQGKSLEESSLPPPEGAPRLVPETQREPREKNGEARWLWPEESGSFLPSPKEERPRARLVPENFPERRKSSFVVIPSQKLRSSDLHKSHAPRSLQGTVP